jgi:ribonuclease P protein component
VAATGRRWVAPAFVLQAGPRPSSGAGSGAGAASAEIGLGFTASRRVGKAVARNRAKRRLRAATRAVLPGDALPAFDYVVIARQAVLTWPFDRLCAELATAFARVTRKPVRRRQGSPPGR